MLLLILSQNVVNRWWNTIWWTTIWRDGDSIHCIDCYFLFACYCWNYLCYHLLYILPHLLEQKVIKLTDGWPHYKLLIIDRLIHLSNPKLNLLIVLGAIVLYIDVYLFVIPTTDQTAVAVLCNVTNLNSFMRSDSNCHLLSFLDYSLVECSGLLSLLWYHNCKDVSSLYDFQ